MVNYSPKSITLLTGDVIVFPRYIDKDTSVKIEPSKRIGYIPKFHKEVINGDIYIYPTDVVPFISNLIDKELFNITKLLEYEYDDINMNYIPMIIMIDENLSQQEKVLLFQMLRETGSIQRELSIIHALSVHLQKTHTPKFFQFILTTNNHANNSFHGIKKIFLDSQVKVGI